MVLEEERREHHARASAATGRDGLQSSRTVAVLTLLWNSGVMTPQTMQKIAMAVEQDMLVMRDWNFAKMVHDGELVSMEMDTYKDLAVLAKIGAEGVHQQNCLRDLHRQLPRSSIEMPPPIKIPLKIMPGDPPEIKLTDQCVMLPHVLFAHICHRYKNVWEGRFVPSTEQLNAFWDAQEGNPQLDHEDLRDRSDLRDRCVPLRMHSDGVVVT